MIRALIWAAIFAAGFWAGGQYNRVAMGEACINAGGTTGPEGLCRDLAR